jgi:hypothetical protein
MMEKSGQKSLKRKRENVVGLDGSDFQKFAKKKKDKKSSKTSIVEKVTSGTGGVKSVPGTFHHFLRFSVGNFLIQAQISVPCFM